jgi:hypothetical protein
VAVISNIVVGVFLALSAADRTTIHSLKIKRPREQSVRGLLLKAVLQKQEHRCYRSCIALSMPIKQQNKRNLSKNFLEWLNLLLNQTR